MDELYLILRGCWASGRYDLAQKAVRAYPCRNSSGLLTLVRYCQVIKSNDLAAAAIEASRCTGTDELVAVAHACRDIAREDLLDGIIVAQPCADRAAFLPVFTACMELNRMDLATKTMEKFYGGTGKRGKVSLADFQAAAVVSISAHSAKFSFEDWRTCLDCAFSTFESLAACHQTLEKLYREWTYHDIQDATFMVAWRRNCRHRALAASSSLSDADVVALRQIISEEGTSWVIDS